MWEEAICNRGKLEWEYKKLLDDKNLEDLRKMTSEELEEYELRRMKYNVGKVCEEIVSRIDGASVPGGYLRAFKAQNKDDMFFLDRDFLLDFLSKGDKEKQNLPGSTYYKKISEFIRLHGELGMKHSEILKFDCMKKLGKECSFCEERPWVGPPCSRVPGPMPDYDRIPEYHCKHVSATPYEINNIQRQIDDFQPRKMLDIAFKEKVVQLNDEQSIDQFCKTYIY